jgi:hypothetical protein
MRLICDGGPKMAQYFLRDIFLHAIFIDQRIISATFISGNFYFRQLIDRRIEIAPHIILFLIRTGTHQIAVL